MLNIFKKKKGALVSHVTEGSIAEEVGIVPGDRLRKINGERPEDIIDYKILVNSEEIELVILKENNTKWFIEIEKEIHESLGVSFSPVTMNPVKECDNNCIFCFIRQNPPGMRDTVTFRDDDYRLSFLEGNYITLNNLSDNDLKRITESGISPLYISIHTTNPELRQKMMGNPLAGTIMEKLRTLTEGGIHLHGQIVVCPEWNDKGELERSINDLISLGPAVESLAVVPVGLTSHRQKLTPLRPVTREDAAETLSIVHRFQEKMLAERDVRFVFASDEYYLAADEPIPPEEAYEDYPQLANGVGLLRLFTEEYNDWTGAKIHPEPQELLKVTMVTGEAAQDYLSRVASFYNRINNLEINLEVIPNRFFGSNVTVAGLITGLDLEEALRDKDPGEAVFIPGIALKEGEALFLDGRSLGDVASALGAEITPVYSLNELSEAIGSLAERKG